MRRNSDATIAELALAIGKSKTSTVGLTDSAEGHWRLTEKPPAREPASSWVSPVRGTDTPAQRHLT